MVGEYLLIQAASEAGFNSILNGGTPLFALERVRRMKNDGRLQPALAESRDEALRVLLGAPDYMNAEQMNQALAQPADLSGWDEAALANRDLLEGLEDVPALSLALRLRAALNRTSLFYQYIPPLVDCDERTPYLDTQIASFIVSVPPNHRVRIGSCSKLASVINWGSTSSSANIVAFPVRRCRTGSKRW